MILLFLISQILVNGTFNTWTNGQFTWAGNPYCVYEGINLIPSSGSEAIDNGAWIEGHHCPFPGPGPAQNVGYCQEWYGQRPDIGACEVVPITFPNKPLNSIITVTQP